ncbi:MAG: hypothetical protein L0Y32_05600 [Nevskiales bacterium]|nr:hypothetical protein [Nevskiales bacterium]
MDASNLRLSDYLAALRRRRVGAAAVAGTILTLSLLVSAVWPPVYTSTATILIEEQDIPSDLVRSMITTYAWQRIQTISQRVMTRDTLLGVIDKYGLYADLRGRKTSEDILSKMRADTRLAPISADVIDPRSGRPTEATIAFTLTYESTRADLAQRVASELTSLYLSENLKSRTERADEAFNFLRDEASRLSTEIAELETRLARFKEDHGDNLPELTGLNLQRVERAERELLDTQTQLRSLDERQFYLEGQLAQLSPTSPVYAPTGERVLDPVTRLKAAQSELVGKQARYSPDHPDIVRLEREIEGLEAQTGRTASAQQQARELARARTELAAVREKYTDDHPDVVRLEAQIQSLEAVLAGRAPETEALLEKPDNPAYISLQAQLEGIRSETRALEQKRGEISARLADHEQRLALAPNVEKAYLELRRDYENAQIKYREIRSKQMEAQIGQQLEKDRKGERFSLIDPPQVPERPTRPNRELLLVLGLILSAGAGIGYVFAAETLDTSVRGTRALTALFESAPLSVIPYVEDADDAARRRRLRRWLWGGGLAAAVVFAILVPFLVMPWDVLWFKGLRVLTGE